MIHRILNSIICMVNLTTLALRPRREHAFRETEDFQAMPAENVHLQRKSPITLIQKKDFDAISFNYLLRNHEKTFSLGAWILDLNN